MRISHNDVVDPTLYSDELRLHQMLAELRHNDPVRWKAPSDYWPFWALTKHADIMEVERQSSQFIVGPRNRLVTIEEEERVRAKTGGKPLMRTLPTMDDPDHRKYRNVTRRWFQPGSLRALESKVAKLSKEYVDLIQETDGEIDFVREISVWFPLRVIMLILGVPEEDGEMMHRLTGQLFSPHDPDTARQTDGHAIAEAGAELFAYYKGLLEERKKSPRNDLASEIANAKRSTTPPSTTMKRCPTASRSRLPVTRRSPAQSQAALTRSRQIRVSTVCYDPNWTWSPRPSMKFSDMFRPFGHSFALPSTIMNFAVGRSRPGSLS